MIISRSSLSAKELVIAALDAAAGWFLPNWLGKASSGAKMLRYSSIYRSFVNIMGIVKAANASTSQIGVLWNSPKASRVIFVAKAAISL
jgi:hypothetical protein